MFILRPSSGIANRIRATLNLGALGFGPIRHTEKTNTFPGAEPKSLPGPGGAGGNSGQPKKKKRATEESADPGGRGEEEEIPKSPRTTGGPLPSGMMKGEGMTNKVRWHEEGTRGPVLLSIVILVSVKRSLFITTPSPFMIKGEGVVMIKGVLFEQIHF